MRKSFILMLFLSFGGILLISSCEAVLDDIEEGKVIPEVRDPRFANCYFDEDLAKSICDSVLIDFFGAKAHSQLKLNDELSFIGCDEGGDLEMLSFGDENCCLPRTYDLVYDLIQNGDTLCQIPMVAGSEMKFDFISENEKKQLASYALLLNGKIKFDYTDLKALMKAQKMNIENSEIELVRDTLLPYTDVNAYFWDISNPTESDEYRLTRVNATTGEYTGISL